MDEAAEALDLDVVVQHQYQYAQGDAHGAVQVGGRHDAVIRENMLDAQQPKQAGEQVDRQEVEGIHQRDPDEDGQRQRRDEAAVAMHDRLGLVIDHFKQHFDERLETAWHASRGFARGRPHHQAAGDAHGDRPEHGVVVDDRKIDDKILVLVRQVSQVVGDVL